MTAGVGKRRANKKIFRFDAAGLENVFPNPFAGDGCRGEFERI